MNFNIKRVSDRWLIFIVLLILLGISGILWSYGNKLNTLWNQQPVNVSSKSVTTDTNSLILSALRVLYTNQAVTDPINQRVYIPEAHIYLPMTDLTRSFYYYNVPANGSEPQAVSVNTLVNLTSPLGTFNAVSCVQRLAGFTIGSRDDSLMPGASYDSSYQLPDGRTLYFYTNSNTAACQGRWSPQTPAAVVAALKQAQSY